MTRSVCGFPQPSVGLAVVGLYHVVMKNYADLEEPFHARSHLIAATNNKTTGSSDMRGLIEKRLSAG